MSIREQQFNRPSAFQRLSEFNLPLQAVSSLLSLPELLLAPRGDKHPVLLLPGFGASDLSLRPLLNYVRSLGYRASTWGIGRNDGRVEALVEAVGTILSHRAEQHEEPVSLVGWSLGGVVARELARTQPENVRQVITMGTPIKGGPKYTAVGALFNDAYGDLDELEREIERRNASGISAPVTSIYSKLDGIVPWQTSVDSHNAHAENIEVLSTHIGLGFHPRVLRIVAEKLAAPVESRSVT